MAVMTHPAVFKCKFKAYNESILLFLYHRIGMPYQWF